MPIKGIFNEDENHEILKQKIAELDRKNAKLNTFEVHIKRLLKLEEKIFPLLKIKEELIEGIKTKPVPSTRNRNPEYPPQTIQKEFSKHNQMVIELTKKLNDIEDVLSNLTKESTAHSDSPDSTNTRQSLSFDSTKLHESIEGIIVQMLAPYLEKVDLMDKRIDKLEQSLSLFQESQSNIFTFIKELDAKVSHLADPDLNSKDRNHEQAVVIKEIHIDKFFLDKYEQNNNIAQLGIKELSGALNIGATYGHDFVPKELTEKLKEDMNKIMDFNNGGSKNPPDSTEKKDSSTEKVNEDEPFTEIPVEFLSDDESS